MGTYMYYYACRLLPFCRGIVFHAFARGACRTRTYKYKHAQTFIPITDNDAGNMQIGWTRMRMWTVADKLFLSFTALEFSVTQNSPGN